MRTVTATMMALALGALIGCHADPPQARCPSDDAVVLARNLCDTEPLSQMDAERAIRNARNAEQSVVFVSLDWSADSIIATFSFAQFMLDYYSSHPDSQLLFHHVDCTSLPDNYALLTEIPGWHDLEREANRSLIHGYGEVAWLKNGQVLRVESFRGAWHGGKVDIDAIERFVAITDELLADPT